MERLANAVLKRAVRDQEREWLLTDEWAAFWVGVAGYDTDRMHQRVRERWSQMVRTVHPR